MKMWLLAMQGSSVVAAGKYGVKFFTFWIIVVLILAGIVGIPVLLMRNRRQPGDR
jgi:hypothetical protein